MKAAWHTELNAQFYRESEIVSLLLRATSWIPDPELLFLLPSWEAAWLPRATEGIADRTQGLTIDIAALGHAHTPCYGRQLCCRGKRPRRIRLRWPRVGSSSRAAA